MAALDQDYPVQVLSLAGLPKGAYRVALTLKVRRNGRTRTVHQKRTFRTCTPKGK